MSWLRDPSFGESHAELIEVRAKLHGDIQKYRQLSDQIGTARTVFGGVAKETARTAKPHIDAVVPGGPPRLDVSARKLEFVKRFWA